MTAASTSSSVRPGASDTATVIIDAHHHLWDPGKRSYPWMDESVGPLKRRFGAEDLAAAIAGTDVGATVLVQASHLTEETRWLREQTAPVAGVVGWTDLTAESVRDDLAELLADGAPTPLVGVRHQAHDEPDPRWLTRPEVVRGVRALGEAGLPFDLLVRRREWPAALELVAAAPDTVMVLDHAGKPEIADHTAESFAMWRAWLHELAAHPQVVCKVSGLLTEAGPGWREGRLPAYAREVLETFGLARTMYGSDWPVSTLRASYAEVLAVTLELLAGCSADEREEVLAGTARRIYRRLAIG